MKDFWDRIRHFKPEEFDDPDQPGSYRWMDKKTILLLDWLRKNTGWPVVTHNKFGVHGCVCMTKGHHSPNSFHNYDNPHGCSAVDAHFVTNASVREQAQALVQSGFQGIGIYQDCWRWVDKNGEAYTLPFAWHVDRREHFQIWKYEKGDYIYLLK